MTSDRELLELAAKASGLLELALIDKDMQRVYQRWNPLTDDGDALRLAVKLGIDVWVDGDIVWCNQTSYQNDKSDPYAATRRAIVRAAAEIGKGMK